MSWKPEVIVTDMQELGPAPRPLFARRALSRHPFGRAGVALRLERRGDGVAKVRILVEADALGIYVEDSSASNESVPLHGVAPSSSDEHTDLAVLKSIVFDASRGVVWGYVWGAER